MLWSGACQCSKVIPDPMRTRLMTEKASMERGTWENAMKFVPRVRGAIGNHQAWPEVRGYVPLLAVLVLAGGIRLAYLLAASRVPLFDHPRMDSVHYHEAGRAIAGGDLALGHDIYHNSPLYSYLLGIVYSIAGDGPWPIRLVQLVMGLVTVALIHASAQRVYGPRWALALALCAGLYGPFIYFDGQLQADGVAGLLQALLIFTALRACERPSPRRWLLAGITLGLAVVARPLALLYVVPLGVAAGRRSTSWRARVGVAIGLALPIAPVTLRNALVAGEAVLVTDSGGLNLFIGNGPGAMGTFRVPAGMQGATHALGQIAAFRAVAEQAAGRRLTARQVDRYWIERTLRGIREHPLDWARVMGEKFWLFWNRRELPNIEDYEFNRHINPVLHLPFVQFGWIAPAALLGSVALLVRRNPAEQLIGGINVTGCLGIIAVFVLARYRISVVPGLIIAAGAGVRTVVDAVKGRRWILLGGAGLVVAGGVVLAQAEKLPKAFDDEYFKLGYVYHVDGRLVDAERCYRAALALNAENLHAHNNLASLYDTIGNKAAAKEHWLATERIAQATGQSRQLERARRQLSGQEP